MSLTKAYLGQGTTSNGSFLLVKRPIIVSPNIPSQTPSKSYDKFKRKIVTLKALSLKGEIEILILTGWIDGTKVAITSILTNTAVYYPTAGRADKKFVETLDRIEVIEIKILPVRESGPPLPITSF